MPRALTHAINDRWPEYPPYEGRHGDIRPHLTIAYGPESELGEVEQHLVHRLPLYAPVDAAALYVFDGRRWQLRSRLPLGGALP